MTLRILLLVLTVGLFVAVWSNDRPAAQRLNGETRLAASQPRPGGSARAAGRFPAGPFLQTAPVAVMRAASEHAAANPRQAMEVKPTAVLPLRTSDLTLPNDLAAGEYRVVSSDGRVRSLTVSNFAPSHEARPELELFTLTADGVRWYFIRLQDAASVPAPMPALLPEWNCASSVGEVLAMCRCDFGMLCDCSCQWCDKSRRRVEARWRQAESWIGSLWTLVQRRLAAGGEATRWE